MDLVELKMLLDGMRPSFWELWMPVVGAVLGGGLTVVAAYFAAKWAIRNVHKKKNIDSKYDVYTKYLSALTRWASNIKCHESKSEYIQARNNAFLLAEEDVIIEILNFESIYFRHLDEYENKEKDKILDKIKKSKVNQKAKDILKIKIEYCGNCENCENCENREKSLTNIINVEIDNLLANGMISVPEFKDLKNRIMVDSKAFNIIQLMRTKLQMSELDGKISNEHNILIQ